MSSRDLIQAASVGNPSTVYVDDVFSTYAYAGTSATQSINNGIDLAGNGGLVWIKHRNAVNEARLVDTVRGIEKAIYPSSTSAQTTETGVVSTFNNNGFTLTSVSSTVNNAGNNYVSWTFRKQPKFFDVVTYTGDGTSNRQIAHSLGITPGMIIIKKLNNTSNWTTIANTPAYSSTGPGLGSGAGSAGTANINNGGNATGFGCGGGGAGYYGGNGGNGFFGGGGGGAAGYTGTQNGGAGGAGAVLINYNSTSVIFTSGTSWTVPSGVTSIKVWAIGAGGGGAGCGASDGTTGGGGGAGGVAVKTWTVSPGNTITFTIGSAGTYGSSTNSGLAGGNTSVTFSGLTITGNGGNGGQYNTGSAAAGGSAVNGDTNSQGGTGGSGALGDTGGSGGGAIGGGVGGTPSSAGANGAQSVDISGLFAALSLTTSLGELYLNLTNAAVVPATSVLSSNISTITLSSTSNTLNDSYVAYLFAHDTRSDGMIQCGSFTTDGSGNATVNLGWEPQLVMVKASSTTGNWSMLDVMRGNVNNKTATSGDATLLANASSAESNSYLISPTATGFENKSSALASSTTYIYLAIRRPNKPMAGTQVYTGWTGNSSNPQYVSTGFSPDMLLIKQSRSSTNNMYLTDRLRGAGSTTNSYSLVPSSNTAESNGVTMANLTIASGGFTFETTITSAMAWAFKRAPGFLDIVCYTGTGVARTVNHNLGVVPELTIVKVRNDTKDWAVYSSSIGATNYLKLNANTASGTTTLWNNTDPTSTVFSLGVEGGGEANKTSATYVAYLFATLPGIQYINSYVGDGTTGRVINCGFSAGARFVMIKATSTTGSWWVYDSARGIVAAADPALQLNSIAAEVTSADAVDPSSSGFIVNQEATCNLNVNGVTYLVWAIA
jgi:hypothetical protein